MWWKKLEFKSNISSTMANYEIEFIFCDAPVHVEKKPEAFSSHQHMMLETTVLEIEHICCCVGYAF